ncbi:hypothetical protein RQP46_001442 [Phenoliferia psychrophenolica]
MVATPRTAARHAGRWKRPSWELPPLRQRERPAAQPSTPTAMSVARLAALIPPKIASPAVSAGGSASRMATVVDFYSKLPKGALEKKSAGFSPIAQYKARYFSGDNASGAPFIHAIGVLFLVGYTIDYNMHLKHHKNNVHVRFEPLSVHINSAPLTPPSFRQ